MKPLSGAVQLGYLYNDRSKKGDIQGSALLSWHNAAGTLGVLASFQRTKDRLRRDGLESYGTIPASFWAGQNDADEFAVAGCGRSTLSRPGHPAPAIAPAHAQTR